MSGQSIRDRVNAAMLSIAGQGLAKSVCKSTTEEIMGPKKKHLDYLLQCTNEPNVSIPQLADLLVERTQLPSWVAVFKSLITIHNLMNYGNERFTQYLASSNCSFNLSGFLDKSGVQVSHPTGSSSTDSHPMKTEGYDMSTFIRRYGKYLNEKAVSYRLMAFDFCKVRRGKDDGTLRTMNAEKLLKTLPILQAQLDALLEFDCTPNELTNGVINACFLLMFKDLIRLFACYNDGIINLLEKYFDMNKKQCKEALEIYKKFLVRMDKVSEFLKVAENVGIDKGDIPDLAKAPSSLLDALEQHLASLEGKKVATNVKSGVTAGELDCGTGDRPDGFTAALNTMANASAAFSVSDDEKKLIIEEENMRLHQLKEQRLKELNQASPPATSPQSQPTSILQSTNPFSSAIPAQAESPSINFLGTSVAPTKPSDDLLSLSGNPFADSIQNTIAVNSVSPSTAPMTSTPWGSQAPSVPLTTTPSGSAVFASDDAFAAVFPNSTPSASVGLDVSPINIVTSPAAANPAAPMDLGDPLDLLDPLLTGAMAITSSSPTAGPQRSLTPSFLETASCMGRASPALSTTSDPGFDAFGDVLQPQKNASEKKDPTGKLIQGDLESSLAQLAGNLNINGPASQVKKTEHQWHPKGEQRKTGGANFQGPSPSSATLSSMWGGGNQQFTQPPISGSQMGFTSPVAPQQQMAMGQPRPIGMSPVPPAAGIGITQPIFGMSQPNLQSVGIQRVPQSTTQTQPNDPFGAL